MQRAPSLDIHDHLHRVPAVELHRGMP
jgi:hypothetical protein